MRVYERSTNNNSKWTGEEVGDEKEKKTLRKKQTSPSTDVCTMKKVKSRNEETTAAVNDNNFSTYILLLP